MVILLELTKSLTHTFYYIYFIDVVKEKEEDADLYEYLIYGAYDLYDNPFVEGLTYFKSVI
jgi:hypothetical protein